MNYTYKNSADSLVAIQSSKEVFDTEVEKLRYLLIHGGFIKP
jgi:hypothetical protein